MTELPFIYVCSHAGKIGNFRWVNSGRGYWGRWGYVDPCPSEDKEESVPLP